MAIPLETPWGEFALIWCEQLQQRVTAHDTSRHTFRRGSGTHEDEGMRTKEDAMTDRSNRPNASDHPHPLIYAVVAGLVLWFVLSVWLVFGAFEHTRGSFSPWSVACS
jgi:hypothetical protein